MQDSEATPRYLGCMRAVVGLQILADVVAAAAQERKQRAQRGDLVLPHMRAVLDDEVERPVGGRELREMFEIRLVGELDLDALGLEQLALGSMSTPMIFACGKYSRPGLQRSALVDADLEQS